MTIVTPEDFLKGKEPRLVVSASKITQLQEEKKQEEAGYLSRVGQSISGRLKGVAETGANVYAGTATPLELGLRTSGAVAGGLTDIVSEAVKKPMSWLVDKISNIKAVQSIATNPTVSNQLDNIQFGVEKYKGWAEKNPEAAKNLEDIFNIGTLIIGGQPTGQIAKTGIKTGAKGLGTAIGGTGSAITVTGRVLKKTGSSLYERAITPTVGEAERILSYEAKSPFLTRSSEFLATGENVGKPITRATTALEKGILGREKDVGIQAKRISQKLWKEKIAPAVEQSKTTISKDELFAPIINRISETVEPGKRQALQDAFEAIKTDYKNITNYSLKQAQKLKSEIDEFTPQKMFRGKDVANEYNSLKHDIADVIRQKTYNALSDRNIRKDYIDYGNLIELEKVGVKAISESGTKGGFGGFWTSMWDMATTPIKTIGGQMLYRVGNKLEFIGEKGIKKFGDFLISRGFNKPTANE